MASTAPATATCSFIIDDASVRYAQTKAVAFTSTSTKLAVGAAGGLVGGVLLAQHAKSGFFARLVTPPGEYTLSVNERGLGIGRPGLMESVWNWSDIEFWSADKKVFMAQDRAGNFIVLPRSAVPEQLFSLVEEICVRTMKTRKRSIARSGYNKWSEIGIGEKFARGLIFTLGFLVMIFALLTFAVV